MNHTLSMFGCSQTDVGSQVVVMHAVASCSEFVILREKKPVLTISAVTCRSSNGHVLQHTLLFRMSCLQGRWTLGLFAECEARDCLQSAGDTLLNRRHWAPVGRVQSTTCTAQMAFEGNQLFHFEVPELPRLWFNIEHISSFTTTTRQKTKACLWASSTSFSYSFSWGLTTNLTLTYILLTLYNLI